MREHLRAVRRTMAPMSRAAQPRYRLTATSHRSVRAPEPEVVLAVIETLPRDGHALLQSLDDPEVYIQVWLRPDSSYQLELREGSVDTHVQTRSVSRERVAAAFTGWLEEHSRDGEAVWRGNYQWDDTSATFPGRPLAAAPEGRPTSSLPTRQEYRAAAEPLLGAAIAELLSAEGFTRRGWTFARRLPDAVQSIRFDFYVRPPSFRSGAQLTLSVTSRLPAVEAALVPGMTADLARDRTQVVIPIFAPSSDMPSKVWSFTGAGDVLALEEPVLRALTDRALPVLAQLGCRDSAQAWASDRFESTVARYGQDPADTGWLLCGLLLNVQRRDDAIEVLRRAYPRGRQHAAAAAFQDALAGPSDRVVPVRPDDRRRSKSC